MAAETPEPTTRLRVTLHLDTPAVIEFEADSVSISRSPMDGRLTKLTWEGAAKTSYNGAPLFIDLDHVVAILVTEVPA